jgi:hypothetical protein
MTEVWQIQVLSGTISIFSNVDKIFGKVQFIFLMHDPDPGHYPCDPAFSGWIFASLISKII